MLVTLEVSVVSDVPVLCAIVLSSPPHLSPLPLSLTPGSLSLCLCFRLSLSLTHCT